ncbi:MAG: putative Death-on-curing family protein [Berkelbacteria bacterium GW2011_GWA1_36_9]|uniref:Putative Death-on-curing family protein n=1 Tax=Berkelbacteria bacterium GW2011_GWA1_36_9 TaxID=1618331 RepID=A0A0G0FLN6_9BACT|nr:MAG: putative Death-on-curing family protein [Berkelbacteria bacterium GW2011_GWA1_36_9]
MKKNLIYITRNGQIKLAVNLKNKTIWLTQQQIAQLFCVDRSVITKHINNVFKEDELIEKSNVQKMHIAGSDKPVKYFSLDLILSVGYRVNSKQATQFRIWANKILKDYLIKGYIVNQKRLKEQAKYFHELQQAIKFIKIKSKANLLSGQAPKLIDLIDEFAQSFTLLSQYDQGKLKLHRFGKEIYKLEYLQIQQLIVEFRQNLIKKKEATTLVGQEISDQFQGIIKTIYQTFDGKELYVSLEEKAANLLYLIIKDHPFTDGNKRIASMLFVYFLAQNQYLYREDSEKKINDNTLVSLALLVAVSDPKDKEVMIKIITNLLK